jgi:hypothetical protein
MNVASDNVRFGSKADIAKESNTSVYREKAALSEPPNSQSYRATKYLALRRVPDR